MLKGGGWVKPWFEGEGEREREGEEPRRLLNSI